MPEGDAMPLQTIELDPGGAPRASVIMLHGLGADGTDFLPLADAMDLSAVGPVRWVFPRAPERPVTVNGGMRMRAWYDILGSDLTRREDEAGLRESFGLVQDLIGRELARGLAPGRIVLAGFSQGCAITLGTGLRCPHRLAGWAGLSGYLPLPAASADERSTAGAGTPVFLGHGEHDGVVPLARGAAARDALRALGHPVDWHSWPIEHSVNMEEVQALQRWLLRILG
jgi:phospholipase/carboxylesterase